MNIIERLIILCGFAEEKPVVSVDTIRFSDLVKNIHGSIKDANESMECVGFKYIERYFDRSPETLSHDFSVLENQKTKGIEIEGIDTENQADPIVLTDPISIVGSSWQQIVNTGLDELENNIAADDLSLASKTLLSLKKKILDMPESAEKPSVIYRPKTIAVEMPVHKNGVWSQEIVRVPLISITQEGIPKVKELTFSSMLERVESLDGDVYVRIPTKNSKKSSATKVEIVFTAEQNTEEIEAIINRHETLLKVAESVE